MNSGKKDCTFLHTNEQEITNDSDKEVTQYLVKLVPEEVTINSDFQRNILEINKPILWTQVLAATTCAGLQFSCSVVWGITGVILPALMDTHSNDLTLDTFEASIFSSIISVGSIFGSILTGFVLALVGQRKAILICLPIGIIFWIIVSISKIFWILVFARFVQGFIVAIIMTSGNNYIGEILHTSVRGRLLGLSILLRQFGYMYVYLVGSTDLSWRNVSLLCGITSMILPLIGMFFLPNSPRWLATKDRVEESHRSLTFFRGPNYDVDSELKEIQEQMTRMLKGTTVCDQLKLLTRWRIAVRVGSIVLVAVLSQFTGSYTIVVYCLTIFENAEVSISSRLSTIIMGIVRIIGVTVYIVVADKLGRRPSLITTLVFSGISMFGMSSFYFIKDITGNTVSWIPLTSLVSYVFFMVIFQSIQSLLNVEMMPTPVRPFASGILSLAFFIAMFCAAISYPYMVSSIGSGWIFMMYGVICIILCLFIAIAIPETKGKKLEDIL